MKQIVVRALVAGALVASGWIFGNAQQRQGDFVMAIDAPGGQTKIECVRGCTMIGGRDIGTSRAGHLTVYAYQCSGTDRCKATVHGFLVR